MIHTSAPAHHYDERRAAYTCYVNFDSDVAALTSYSTVFDGFEHAIRFGFINHCGESGFRNDYSFWSVELCEGCT